jgi:hypothetical protein
MRGMAVVPAIPAVASAIWATIAAFRMGAWLSAHGVKVNWFWFRVLIPRYADQYKKMTTESDGRPGPLYRQFLVGINLALVFAVLMLIALAVGRR